MNWFVVHIASGESLFSGVAFILIGLLLASQSRWSFLRTVGKIMGLVGAALIWLSSTPSPLWTTSALGLSLLLWVLLEGRQKTRKDWIWGSRLVVGFVCLIVVAMELPYRQMSRLSEAQHNSLYVIGDSISAGIQAGKPNWPSLLQAQCRTRVINLAKPAATLSGGLQQAALIPANASLVLIELGGNDLLGTASAAEFRRDLESLMKLLVRPGRTLVMFELPLLPGKVAIGRSQRTVAKAYGINLIPKRHFARVLGGPEATLDGLHLSATGSAAMAEIISNLLGPSLLR